MKSKRMFPVMLTLLIVILAVSLIFPACSSSSPAPATSVAPKTSAAPATTAAPAPAPSSAPAANPTQAAEAVYEFGAMFPMTGPPAFLGQCFVGALNEAVTEINGAGGIGGTMLKADVEDNMGEAKGGADAMNKIILNKNIAYTLGSFVDPNLSAQPIAARNKVLIMNAGGSANSLLSKDYLWNNNVMASYLEPQLAQYVYDKGFRKVASIIQDNPEGMDNRSSFYHVFTSLGGQTVDDEVFETTDMDFATQLTKIKAAKPDLVYMNAVALQASTILKQIKELGITAQVCGPWIDDPGTLFPAGNNADGAISVSAYLDPSTKLPFGANFIKTYNEKYAPKGGTAYWPWANAYENVYILAELVKRVKATGGDPHSGEALLNALQSNPTFDSVFGSGKMTFNTAEHDVVKDVVIATIQNGQPVTQKVVPYTDVKSVP